MTTLIISGGGFDKILPGSDYIIACDKGYKYAKLLNIKPDLIVGDFDSYKEELPSDIPYQRYPREKDDTDTLAAIRKALSMGSDTIYLICALGGRKDHEIANYQAAAYAAKCGANCMILSANETITFLRNASKTFNIKDGSFISVISFSDKCSGVYIKGAKYEIEDATIDNTFPIGISNEFKYEEMTVSLKSGILMIIQTKKEPA